MKTKTRILKTRNKKKTIKNKRGGGLLKRSLALVRRKKVKTFCCKSKTSEYATGHAIRLGNKNKNTDRTLLMNTGSGTNTGYDCEPSYYGQCHAGYGENLHNYKFRCFDTKPDKDGEIGIRKQITESTWLNDGGISIDDSDNELEENCQYIAGTLGKIGSTVGNFPQLAVNGVKMALENA
jgi:hypothetical protein